ncbi:MAG: phenylacetate-coenzyme A ligase PaaK-like adenylate-forming protein [Flavobacteriales bacterium]|jgi:phenylacetate-coenzyme A ligase PaaK-like adenylate-forming protein
MQEELRTRIFTITTAAQFQELALDIFRYQFEQNATYRSFCDLLYIHPSDVKCIEDIPFLPIEFFKTRDIRATKDPIQTTFTSSGTTGTATSKHHVSDLKLYEKSFMTAFTATYGNIEDYVVLALLPSYLERSGSSLVYMVDALINQSNHTDSGFYLKDHFALSEKLHALNKTDTKVLLIGVSFALLDLTESHSFTLKNTIVMETGGMKGRRKEIIREELHDLLRQGFGITNIHSEYGMTELLSQAYAKDDGVFHCPPWMKVFTRDPEDALSLYSDTTTGGLNIIDLANLDSCAFIATQDLGKVYPNGTFTVAGRFDNSDIRGCNLMAL